MTFTLVSASVSQGRQQIGGFAFQYICSTDGRGVNILNGIGAITDAGSSFQCWLCLLHRCLSRFFRILRSGTKTADIRKNCCNELSEVDEVPEIGD